MAMAARSATPAREPLLAAQYALPQTSAIIVHSGKIKLSFEKQILKAQILEPTTCDVHGLADFLCDGIELSPQSADALQHALPYPNPLTNNLKERFSSP